MPTALEEKEPAKARPHLDYVDGLRALCALWGVGRHSLRDSNKMSHTGQVLAAFSATTASESLRSSSSPDSAWPFRPCVLQARPLVWGGTFSYSIYLMHAPLLAAWVHWLVRPTHLSSPLQFGMMLLLVAPLTVGLAWVFFYFCERPFLTPALRKHEEEMKSGLHAGTEHAASVQ